MLRSDQRLVEVEVANPATGDQLRVMLAGAALKGKNGTDRAAPEAAGSQRLDKGLDPGQAIAERQQQAVKAKLHQETGGVLLVTLEEIRAYLHASGTVTPFTAVKRLWFPDFSW